MRSVFVLKTILDILFIFTIFGLLNFPILFFFEAEVVIENTEINIKTLNGKIVLGCFFVAYAIFTYVIYLFRRTAYLLLRRRIFDEKIIQNLYRIGVSLIVMAIFTKLPIIFYVTISKTFYSLNITNYPFLFNIAVGLFFMIMSKVMLIAKNMKEENELTV
ncbi:MAG: DUF2975 domain-containing protein [Capnocytophaga sp.]|nr:DUF2975 domain-containing protein [Capnocytophaga sp.]